MNLGSRIVYCNNAAKKLQNKANILYAGKGFTAGGYVLGYPGPGSLRTKAKKDEPCVVVQMPTENANMSQVLRQMVVVCT